MSNKTIAEKHEIPNKIVIAIDNGKHNMKAKCGDKEIIYANKYSKRFSENLAQGSNNTFNVEYKGKQYTVGENATLSDSKDGKGSPESILQALTVITRFIEPNKNYDNIVVGYGECVTKYFNELHKKDHIIDKLETNHNIVVDGEEYRFSIEKVYVLPEGIGHILSDISNYLGVQYVIDIGGSTINFLRVINGMPDRENCDSYPLGVNNIITKINKEARFNSEVYGNPDMALLSQYLTSPTLSPVAKLNELITDTIEAQLDDFENHLGRLGINVQDILKSQPIVFTGGGSQLLKSFINKRYKCDMVDNLVLDGAVWSNVRGFDAYVTAKTL